MAITLGYYFHSEQVIPGNEIAYSTMPRKEFELPIGIVIWDSHEAKPTFWSVQNQQHGD